MHDGAKKWECAFCNCPALLEDVCRDGVVVGHLEAELFVGGAEGEADKGPEEQELFDGVDGVVSLVGSADEDKSTIVAFQVRIMVLGTISFQVVRV